MGQYAEAERYFREARELSIEQAAPHTVAFATCGLAYVYFAQGRMETAAKFAEEGREIAREVNNADRESVGLVTMSLAAAITGDTRRALELCEASLEVGIGRYFRSYADWALAMIHCALHHPEHAWHHLQASHHSVQVPASIPRMLAVAAVLLGEEGEIERAAEVLGAVMNDRHSAAGWMEQWEPFTVLRARLYATLGHAKYQSLLDQGAKLNAEKLADELLGRSTEAGTSA
jgi:tetratricopeptide (TPR) repeat protein